jgi:hypothetical protein
LFLLGMRIMTDGLKAVAEDRLHRWLARVTHTPLSGAATGALTTAVIQSSTATTVATVGFVVAGLLTFGQAPGVIFGANIGTTGTAALATLGASTDSRRTGWSHVIYNLFTGRHGSATRADFCGEHAAQRSWKRTGTRTAEGTGRPPRVSGEKDQRLTADIAAVSRSELPELLARRTEETLPLVATAACTTTRPSIPSRRAVPGYTGGIRFTTLA